MMRVKSYKYYVYLGTPFSSDGLTSSSIKINANLKMCQALKFVSFCYKNNDIPFYVKKKIFHSAVVSSLIYGCESWLNSNIKPMEKLYRMCVKHLLGVRNNTTTALCLVELGFPPLKAIVKERQRKFFKKIWAERRDMRDDPFSHAMRLMRDANVSTMRYINDLIENEVDDIGQAMEDLHAFINNSQSSRCQYYREINPDLSMHNIYKAKLNLNDVERISWSKLRLSAHSLAIETGRWSRRGRGRLPVEERLCRCGLVQTEHHVVEECALSQHIRNSFNVSSILDLFNGRHDYSHVCKIAHDILNIYK